MLTHDRRKPWQTIFLSSLGDNDMGCKPGSYLLPWAVWAGTPWGLEGKNRPTRLGAASLWRLVTLFCLDCLHMLLGFLS